MHLIYFFSKIIWNVAFESSTIEVSFFILNIYDLRNSETIVPWQCPCKMLEGESKKGLKYPDGIKNLCY